MLQDQLDRASLAGMATFDQAFNAPPLGLSVHEISREKKFTRVSAGHQALLGYRPSDLVGRLVTDFVVLKDISDSAMNRKLAPGALLRASTRSFRRADGTEISLLQLDRHVKDDLGHIVGIRTAMCETPKLG